MTRHHFALYFLVVASIVVIGNFLTIGASFFQAMGSVLLLFALLCDTKWNKWYRLGLAISCVTLFLSAIGLDLPATIHMLK